MFLFFFYFLLCFFLSPVFLKTRLFCDEQWSCFVLNLFDFLQEKKKFLLLLKYICIWWYSGRAVGLVYPDVLATKWDKVLTIRSSTFPSFGPF